MVCGSSSQVILGNKIPARMARDSPTLSLYNAFTLSNQAGNFYEQSCEEPRRVFSIHFQRPILHWKFNEIKQNDSITCTSLPGNHLESFVLKIKHFVLFKSFYVSTMAVNMSAKHDSQPATSNKDTKLVTSTVHSLTISCWRSPFPLGWSMDIHSHFVERQRKMHKSLDNQS